MGVSTYISCHSSLTPDKFSSPHHARSFTEICVGTQDGMIVCSLDQGLYRHPVKIFRSLVRDILSSDQINAAEANDFRSDTLDTTWPNILRLAFCRARP